MTHNECAITNTDRQQPARYHFVKTISLNHCYNGENAELVTINKHYPPKH